MKGVISTIKIERRFFTEIEKIGDVIKHEGKTYLILGIEKFKIFTNSIYLWYTVQDLKNQDYQDAYYKGYGSEGYISMVVRMKYDDSRFGNIEVGRVLPHKEDGHMHKIMEFTDISINGTDIIVSFLGKKLMPVSRKDARDKMLLAKQKELNLEIY